MCRVTSELKSTLTNQIASISEDFMGFGYETSAVAQPRFFNRNNTRMIKLYGNLSQHGLIRIGGDVSDHTLYMANGVSAAKTDKEVSVINWANLTDLGDFIRRHRLERDVGT